MREKATLRRSTASLSALVRPRSTSRGIPPCAARVSAVFVAVAEHKSFTRGADALGRQPPEKVA
jgi:hypothetical protein